MSICFLSWLLRLQINAAITQCKISPVPLKVSKYCETTTTHPPVHQSLDPTHKYLVMNKNLITVAAELLRKHSHTNHRQLFSISTNAVLNINLTHFQSSIPVRSQSRQLEECNAKSWNCTSWLWTEACWEVLYLLPSVFQQVAHPPWSLNYCSSVRPSKRDGFDKYDRRCCILSLI